MKAVSLFLILLIGLIFIPVIILSNDVHALDIPEVRAQLKISHKDMGKIHKDFADFMTSFQDTNPDEFHICQGMSSHATSFQDVAFTTSMFLYLYSLITEQKNKEIGAKLIMDYSQVNVSSAEEKIANINGYLALSKSPIVVTTGSRLKEEIRKLKQLLESVKLP